MKRRIWVRKIFEVFPWERITLKAIPLRIMSERINPFKKSYYVQSFFLNRMTEIPNTTNSKWNTTETNQSACAWILPKTVFTDSAKIGSGFIKSKIDTETVIPKIVLFITLEIAKF